MTSIGNHCFSGRLLAAALTALLLCAGRAYGAPQGELDATFGENGRLTMQLTGSQFGRPLRSSRLTENCCSPVTTVAAVGDVDFAVLRLDADGTVDGTFGINGIATVDFGFPTRSRPDSPYSPTAGSLLWDLPRWTRNQAFSRSPG